MKTQICRGEWLEYLKAKQHDPYVPTIEQRDEISRLFPNVDPGVRPFGQRVLVQLRLSRRTTKSGLVLVDETREVQRSNEAVAQIIALGPLAFRKRDTLERWGEGAWAEEGDFVRVPRFGGDRWEVPVPDIDALAQQDLQKERLRIELRSLEGSYATRDEERRSQLRSELKSIDVEPPPIQVMFAQFNDFELIGALTGSPVDMKVYV